ncbi:hypothetical protein JYQ62_04300 [Nostoc sp. UHCC 0702]|nr:hypothetical protein JYQ62_04300 [Nostoc sp. UHCC 0702]
MTTGLSVQHLALQTKAGGKKYGIWGALGPPLGLGGNGEIERENKNDLSIK